MCRWLSSASVKFLFVQFILLCISVSLLQAEDTEVVILKTREWSNRGKVPTGTIWRGFQTWKNDVIKKEDGSLVEVDPRFPRAGIDKKGTLVPFNHNSTSWGLRHLGTTFKSLTFNPAKRSIDTPYPPAGWQRRDFDDSRWARDPFPQRALYNLTALRCLRGKFEVTDLKQAGELSLRVRFRGGVVVYLNGKEIGRAFLPRGEIKPDTMAEAYPEEAYIDADGKLIGQGLGFRGGHYNKGDNRKHYFKIENEVGKTIWSKKWSSIAVAHAHKLFFSSKDPDIVRKYRSRTRTVEVKIKPGELVKGVNVLAIEIHRAPAWEGMFTSGNIGLKIATAWWDRCELEDVRLTAKGNNGIVANTKTPQKRMVFNHPTSVSLDPSYYGDPNEPLQAVRINGVRNGTFFGQLVVTGKVIEGLKVSLGKLRGPGTMPRSSIRVGYPRAVGGDSFEPIDSAPPASIDKTPWSFKRKFPAMQPIWFSVTIPKDAAPGKYTTGISIEAEGMSKVSTPLEVNVVGKWALPDTRDFKTIGVLLQCPDAVADHYKVKMWSPEHWALLERTFEVLGQIGNKAIFIPLTSKTHLGNPHSMVRWIKQKDGSYKHDASIAEKYLDLAIKHFGKMSVICLFTSTNFRNKDREPRVSEYIPATDELKEMRPPKWGTPESVAFWKPVIEDLSAMISRRKQGHAMMFGLAPDGVGPDFQDMHAISPGTKWIASTHIVPVSWKAKTKAGKMIKGKEFLGAWSWMHGYLIKVGWMGETDGVPIYAWRNDTKISERNSYPSIRLAASRSRSPVMNNDYNADVNRLRITAEALQLQGSARGGYTYQGYGLWGADFWKREFLRFDSFHNVALSETTFTWIVGAGKDGPVPTCRSRNLQMGQQEAEVRMYVQDAILDKEKKAKLGPDLAKRCKDACDARTKLFSFISIYRYNNCAGSMPRNRLIPDIAAWDNETIKLYKLADEVLTALSK